MSVSLHIVDLRQHYVCCTRSGVILCTLFIVLFLCRMCRCGLHEALRTSVHLCASSLQNLAVSPDFYYLVSISVERSYSIPLFDGVGLAGFKSQCLFIGLAARSLFISCCFPFLFFHSMGWCRGVGVFGLIGC